MINSHCILIKICRFSYYKSGFTFFKQYDTFHCQEYIKNMLQSPSPQKLPHLLHPPLPLRMLLLMMIIHMSRSIRIQCMKRWIYKVMLPMAKYIGESLILIMLCAASPTLRIESILKVAVICDLQNIFMRIFCTYTQ